MLVAVANAATKRLAISALRVAPSAEAPFPRAAEVEALASLTTLLVGSQFGDKGCGVAAALALSTLPPGESADPPRRFVSKAAPDFLCLGVLPEGFSLVSRHFNGEGLVIVGTCVRLRSAVPLFRWEALKRIAPCIQLAGGESQRPAILP